MRVNPDFLRELDPRKSYDRGPMALPADPDDTTWTRRDMSDPARDLSSLTLVELRRELARREEAVARLRERRAKIEAELAEVQAEIDRCGGEALLEGGERGGLRVEGSEAAPARARRAVTPRPKNTLSLAEALTAAVDAGAIVSPREAADLVKKTGYLTNSRTFVQTVTVALSKHSGFRRVERGRYECIR
jgi:hypothetical protein